MITGAMYISRVRLERRMFLVGPNASGKSNFLDAIRFVSDVAKPEGSFQRALSRRGDITSIRNLSARRCVDHARITHYGQLCSV